jgi:hypothetical protein
MREEMGRFMSSGSPMRLRSDLPPLEYKSSGSVWRMRARLVPLLAVLLATSLVVADGADAAKKLRPSTLVRFQSCTQLTDFARDWMVQTGGTTGVPGRVDTAGPAVLREPRMMPTPRRTSEGDVQTSMPMPAAAPTATAEGKADTAFSTTNTQEAGVDEPDLIKTDGKTLYAVDGGVLRVYDVTQPAPKPLGTLKLAGSDHQLLLRGPRLLVLANSAPNVIAPPQVVDGPMPTIAAPASPDEAKVLLTEIDVSTPAAPKVARTMELAGRLVDGRLTGGIVRIVVASTPEPVAVAEPEQLEEEVQEQNTSEFVPITTIKSRISRKTFQRNVVPCRRVRHPRAFSGLDLLTVLTVDLDKGLYDVDRDAVMAGAQDVYASPTSLVVASRRYNEQAEGEFGFAPTGGTTELHVFSADDKPVTTYQGSGSVPGFILNQFAISEHEGALRVATTEDAPFVPGGRSESGVSVLKVADGKLNTVGRVTGLGKGERIYAVRFLGDRGYVVTFRQVDPLYTLDLRDPTAPKVTGELKVAGYSAYLHPINDRLLIGVGQDATEQGRRLGPQISLFDVGDPASPKLLHRAALGTEGSSSVEDDHHAFLWWAPLNLAVVPIETYDYETPEKSFAGAVAFRVGTGGVGEVARVTHPKPSPEYMTPPIGRSVVIGDRLLTLSHNGLGVNQLSDLAPLSFTAFG